MHYKRIRQIKIWKFLTTCSHWKTVNTDVSPGISTVAVEKLISCNEGMVREVLRRAIYRQQYGLRRHLRSDWFAVETVKSMSYELKLAAETQGWLWQRTPLSSPSISFPTTFFPPFQDVVCRRSIMSKLIRPAKCGRE